MNIGKKILAIKDEIQSDKDKMNQFKGRRTELLKQLKEDHGISDLKKAEQKASTLSDKIKKLGEEIEEGINSLIDKYGLEDVCL